jgi:DNA polymerase-4
MAMKNLILHVDINSYFATMLQQENPMLRGKPVGVIKSEGRTCIIAASKEAKRLGVSTGARVPEAREKIPGLILVPAEFNLMLSATRKMKALFQTFSPSVHIFSLDEAFLDLTGCEKLFTTPVSYARRIQARIKEVLGEWVTCNVGISHNKLLAKMAGEIAPKGEALMIDDHNLDDVLRTVEFKDVCGVGWGLQKKAHDAGSISSV